MRTFFVILCALFLTACATSGKEVDKDFVATIQKGVTTEAEIRSNLGTPQSTSLNGSGQRVLTYYYAKSTTKASSFIPVVGSLAGGSDTETTTLTILINGKTEIVDEFYYSESETETKTGVL